MPICAVLCKLPRRLCTLGPLKLRLYWHFLHTNYRHTELQTYGNAIPIFWNGDNVRQEMLAEKDVFAGTTRYRDETAAPEEEHTASE